MMETGTVRSQLMDDSVFTAGEKNERQFVAFIASCHISLAYSNISMECCMIVM